MNELHLHIDGSLRLSTLKEWCPNVPDDFGFKIGMNLQDCLACFATTVGALNSPKRLARVVQEICQDQRALGIDKTELRFAPHIHRASASEMIAAASENLEEGFTLVLCGLFGDSPDVLSELIELSKKYPNVVGIDLAGAPSKVHKFKLKDYQDVFRMAKSYGFKTTAHLGEGRPPSEIIDALHLLNLNRIGHGCSLLEDNRAKELIIEKHIVVEACPTSNIHVGVYQNIKEHPIKEWIREGVLVTVCSDNTLMSRTNTIRELELLDLTEQERTWIEHSSQVGLFPLRTKDSEPTPKGKKPLH
jgi:adenosine deaminase